MTQFNSFDRRPAYSRHVCGWALTLFSLLVAGVPRVCAQATGGDASTYSVPTPRPINPAAGTTNPSARAIQTQNPFLGSTPTTPASDTPLVISFADALERGLRYNLGLVESASASADFRAARMRSLAALLPTVTARAAQVYANLSLKEFGLTLPGVPSVTGGFEFQDIRVAVSQSVYSGELRNRYRSTLAAERASTLSARDARDVVVFAVGTAYLQIVSSAARLQTAKAQLALAVELDRLTTDRVESEVAPEIDALRAGVERRTAEQRVVNAQNDLEKDKLTLARIVGLPVEQPLAIEEPPAYRPLAGLTEASARAAALRTRGDLASAQANVEAAEFEVRARHAGASPSVSVVADYGGGGDHTAFNQVYTVAAAVSVPLYTGGRVRADIVQAESDLARRRAEYEDLKGRVAYDVRVAWLDLEASAASVAVAEQNKMLADRALLQAQDRYTNGVASYLEVVASQEAVAHAGENLTACLYAANVAKLALARATGSAENSAKEWFVQ